MESMTSATLQKQHVSLILPQGMQNNSENNNSGDPTKATG